MPSAYLQTGKYCVLCFSKLKALQLQTFVLKWIISVLVGRSQICKTGDQLPLVNYITRGIIQGSGLNRPMPMIAIWLYLKIPLSLLQRNLIT